MGRAGDEVMTFRGSLRRDISAILNPLVVNGEIKGFSTNLYEKPVPDQTVVRVLVDSQREAAEVCQRVSQALKSLGQPVIVQAEIRVRRGRQEPEGPL
jgi:hypothetical protein